MTVYVLKDAYDYEGYDIVGIFSSKDLAIKELHKYVARYCEHYRYTFNEDKTSANWSDRTVSISEFELDKEDIV